MTDNPDDKATAEAAAVLKRMLKERGVEVMQRDMTFICICVISTWIQARSKHWASHRITQGVSDPDAMMLGFTEASLSRIADKASGLPMELPIGKWSKADVTRLFAVAHATIQATAEATLEHNAQPEELPA